MASTASDTTPSFFRRLGFPLALFLYMAAFAMIFPISQNVFITKLCLERYDATVCDNLNRHPDAESKVQAASSKLFTVQSMFTDVPGAIAALLLGALSDRIGRKRVLLAPCVGAFLFGIVMIFQAMIPVVSLPLIIVSCLVFGVSGGIHTFITSAVNIITDSTPEDKRTERLSRTMPFIGLGVLVGMVSSGILPRFLSIIPVYVLFTACQAVVILVVVFFVDESLPSVKAGAATDEAIGGITGLPRLFWNSLIAGIRVLRSPENKSYRLHLMVLLAAGMIGNAAMMVEINLTMLYTKREPFLWVPTMYGLYAAFKNLLAILGQVVGTSLFLRLLGAKSLKNEFRLLQFGSLSAIVVCLLTAVATSTRFMMFAAIFVMFGSPARSANGSIISRVIHPSHKGAFMSLGSFFNTLTTPLLGMVCNTIYASTVNTRPGSVFVFIALLHVFVLFAVSYVISKTPETAAPPGKGKQD